MHEQVFKKDIKLQRRGFDLRVSDRELVDLLASPSGDLATVTGRENLVQAILNRLLTRKGELARLGHPEYGSRLHTLIGELNNTRLQGLAALYIRECLLQETRLREITAISFAAPSRGSERNVLEATVTVKALGSPDDLSLTFALNLGG
jgi:phage baseplate assembly protein W